jgi:hypothetical protein
MQSPGTRDLSAGSFEWGLAGLEAGAKEAELVAFRVG